MLVHRVDCFAGDATSETVAMMEDSMMVLGSLLSNRFDMYNCLCQYMEKSNLTPVPAF